MITPLAIGKSRTTKLRSGRSRTSSQPSRVAAITNITCGPVSMSNPPKRLGQNAHRRRDPFAGRIAQPKQCARVPSSRNPIVYVFVLSRIARPATM